uniref:JmjC domain-containing protein n=1 Tax=Polytomella parva TaxID=51329 RepID=A0A7S0VNE7_9CHLO|mmetsp:Transcript_9173/g.17230  ORF Transcript_9173/g.17230 Transcript_9173/m.17230 type:complete len:653 (+) Transcript_9173:282-2240(+)|eukprot:CAMPEP_0175039374 /NCGR_PEP_ID=MMETSP0052_2-20121109/538_1 /TAXON_ID=51329 ORGANISM="Polytomella parva, Strain SAG 63-3" /NCGR_SAMPLE_ID=MMETSP0052_2 /ASSEMBLY_ACC=CAM_ASM_000194 /LENGTH=652 /DNA_ID=CAMNT_0016301199 /DNA_START=299 /DNA_END=2257 /DNA_ORIENTATION=+
MVNSIRGMKVDDKTGALCPVLRPTREEFSQPFCDYVGKIFNKYPDLPMFKLVPPPGWSPRRKPFPNLSDIKIQVPIRQHAFGTKGAYRCMFVEGKEMTVEEFKLSAAAEARRLHVGPDRVGLGPPVRSRSMIPSKVLPDATSNDVDDKDVLDETRNKRQCIPDSHLEKKMKPEEKGAKETEGEKEKTEGDKEGKEKEKEDESKEEGGEKGKLDRARGMKRLLEEEKTTAPTDHVQKRRSRGNMSVISIAGNNASSDDGSSSTPVSDCVDSNLERAFWANITLNPPMYGADTILSFFDENLSYGWNLRDLGDLLRSRKVPNVPGVTFPMTYFGMWRSFFGWHKEDADLYSVNYLHWGAPKVWYCVPPSSQARFDGMASSMFPELARNCAAFVRHKDILITPAMLRTYGVRFSTIQQNAGEFVVLNAAAYHAGFNTGFNCAEAVNFALKQWIAVGKAAVPCQCEALKDCVRISMSIFDPSYKDPYDDSDEEDEEESSEDEVQGENEEKEVGEEEKKRPRGRGATRSKVMRGKNEGKKKGEVEREKEKKSEKKREAKKEEEEEIRRAEGRKKSRAERATKRAQAAKKRDREDWMKRWREGGKEGIEKKGELKEDVQKGGMEGESSKELKMEGIQENNKTQEMMRLTRSSERMKIT